MAKKNKVSKVDRAFDEIVDLVDFQADELDADDMAELNCRLLDEFERRVADSENGGWPDDDDMDDEDDE